MDYDFEVLESYDSGSGNDAEDVALEYVVTEVDDFGIGGDNGMMIEELSSENAEEVAETELGGMSFSDPEIEEPEEYELEQLNRSVQIMFKDEPLVFDPPLRSNTTLQDLFALTRDQLADISDDDELFFEFVTTGLEVGEENMHTCEPTVAHLLRTLGRDDGLRVNVQRRASFYSSFKDLLNKFDFKEDDDLVNDMESPSSKKAKLNTL